MAEVFFSETSIDPGDDPSRRMLEEGLLKSEVLVAILTREASARAWVIWETAAAWARGNLVIPVFVDVEPAQVPGPLTVRAQGVHLASRPEMDRLLKAIAKRRQVDAPTPLTDAEFSKLQEASSAAVVPVATPAPAVTAWEDTVDDQDPSHISEDGRPASFRMAGTVSAVIVRNDEGYPIKNVTVGWAGASNNAPVETRIIPVVGPKAQKAIARPNSMRGWPPAAISLVFRTQSGEVWSIDANGNATRLE